MSSSSVAFISKELRVESGKIYKLQSARMIDAHNPHCHLPFASVTASPFSFSPKSYTQKNLFNALPRPLRRLHGYFSL